MKDRMIRKYEDITIKSIEFEDYRHLCQWIKTISGTEKTVEEIAKDYSAETVWKRLQSYGEYTINPTLWYEK